ncbi:flagellin [Castellaniella sp.]|uniref:flagellin N-terminal helical domain-containing protein n=1 Tax=Castellaniella sp. TaxID=1955812 RepID=UPI002AFFCC26|nr:flagellin [Castellaniella sp.]
MVSVRTNVSAQQAQNHNRQAGSALDQAIQRLSSGLRINSAKDDAAGQAIANRFTAQITGLAQAARNTNDGISLSQTAQGALDAINARLQRIRELSVQGLSELYNGETGDYIQAEINMNLKEIDRLNQWASFNGVSLLDGTTGTKTLQVGARDRDTLDVDLGPPGFSIQELGLRDLTIQGAPGRVTPVSTLTGSSSRIDLDDAARTTVNYYPPTDSPNLVRPSQSGSRAVVQLDDDGGRLKNVSVNAGYNTDTSTSNVGLSISSPVVSATAGESISSWAYLDDSGNPMALSQPSVVRSGGQYWIKHQYNGAAYYYEAELTVHGNQHKITAQAKSANRVAEADMPGSISQRLTSAPQVPKASADYSMTLDGVDEAANADMQLVYLGGYYYVEEKLSSGQYSYYRADVTVKTGGSQNSITVVSDRSRAISVADEPYVSGTSIAYLKPENQNIQINYVDLDGRMMTDVMQSDGEGGYIFRLDGLNGGGNPVYKTAKVVINQAGDYMLQTANGMGEVMLYYPLFYTNADGTHRPAFDVFSNAESDMTIITVRETDIAQRLRTPPEPLAAIDEAIARVDRKRSELGALDNRLEAIIDQSKTTGADLVAARSRIEDADYAVEVSNMTRAQILQQAGAAVLAQANQVPQSVLSLIAR